MSEHTYKDANRDSWKLEIKRGPRGNEADREGDDIWRWDFVLWKQEDSAGIFRRTVAGGFYGSYDEEPTASEVVAEIACGITRLAVGFARHARELADY